MIVCTDVTVYTDLLFSRCLFKFTYLLTCLYACVCCSWVGLVSKNYEIERACMDLEAEVLELEHKSKKLKKWHSTLWLAGQLAHY